MSQKNSNYHITNYTTEFQNKLLKKHKGTVLLCRDNHHIFNDDMNTQEPSPCVFLQRGDVERADAELSGVLRGGAVGDVRGVGRAVSFVDVVELAGAENDAGDGIARRAGRERL